MDYHKNRMKFYNDLIVSWGEQLRAHNELPKELQDEEHKRWMREELNSCKSEYKKLIAEWEYIKDGIDPPRSNFTNPANK